MPRNVLRCVYCNAAKCAALCAPSYPPKICSKCQINASNVTHGGNKRDTWFLFTFLSFLQNRHEKQKGGVLISVFGGVYFRELLTIIFFHDLCSKVTAEQQQNFVFAENYSCIFVLNPLEYGFLDFETYLAAGFLKIRHRIKLFRADFSLHAS